MRSGVTEILFETGKHRVRTPRPASYCSTLIETFFLNSSGEYLPCGTGTGFFYSLNGKRALITNWHVVSGRHPENPAMTLTGYQCSPTHYRLSLTTKSNPKDFEPIDYVPFYNERNEPNWIESPYGFDSVDVVALPFDAEDHLEIITINEFAPVRDAALEPGIDVCIIGFPFGRNETNPFPVWKRAMIASEPDRAISGRPFVYLDTPGRPGMSGSPVYFVGNGFSATREEAALLQSKHPEDAISALMSMDLERVADRTAVLEFAGIYSGSYGDQNLDKLNLGRFWPAYHLRFIELKGKKGSNPYPPVLCD